MVHRCKKSDSPAGSALFSCGRAAFHGDAHGNACRTTTASTDFHRSHSRCCPAGKYTVRGRSRRSLIRKKMFEFLIAARLTTAVMKAILRCAGVAIAICSWTAISNHCAFAAIATKTGSAQTACPFHSKPTKQKEQAAQVQCCKVLRAIVLAKTKSWARDDANFSAIDLCLHERMLIARSLSPLPLLLDTGPPGARSFAELILQRSLLAHAPPSLG